MFSLTSHQVNANKKTIPFLKIKRMIILNVDGGDETGTPHAYCWECKLVQPFWKAIWQHASRVLNVFHTL